MNLCEDPIIFTVDNFMSKKECEKIIRKHKKNVKPSMVEGEHGKVRSTLRSSSNTWFEDDDIINKISKHVHRVYTSTDQIQFAEYKEGEKYNRHYDGWRDNGSEKSNRCLAIGQRVVTAILYLNDEFTGGNTTFTKLKIDVKPEVGKLLIFHNTYDNSSKLHELSEHMGSPVHEGCKYIINVWFRTQPQAPEHQWTSSHTPQH